MEIIAAYKELVDEIQPRLDELLPMLDFKEPIDIENIGETKISQGYFVVIHVATIGWQWWTKVIQLLF